MTTRLDAVAKSLSEKLRIASPAQRRAASFAVCQVGLEATSVDSPVVLDSLAQLREIGSLPTPNIDALNELVFQLDNRYFELQGQSEVNPILEMEVRLVFGQARAIAAVAFAGGQDSLSTAMEAIYEASVASENDDLVFEAALKALQES